MKKQSKCCSSSADSNPGGNGSTLDYFRDSAQNCYQYATQQKASGKKIVGIYCEFTPREIILAAGAVPICLCGGSHKMVAPAEQDLPANLCPLIKSSYGYIREEACPFFEMADLIVAETTCDGKKKMYELLADRKPIYVLELPYKIDLQEAFDYWRKEIRNLKMFIEDLFDTTITDDSLNEAIALMNEERASLRKVHSYLSSNPSYLKGSDALITRTRISGMPAYREKFPKLFDELEARKSLGQTAYCSTSPRILMTGVPMPSGAEKVLNIIEKCGGAVVCQENCTGIKPVYEDVSANGDPITAIAEKYFHLPCSCMTPNSGRFDLIEKLIKEAQVDAVVDLIWQGCHTYNIESFKLRKMVTEKFNIPYLKIETDYSPSDEQQIALRVESLLEMVKNRQKVGT